MTVVRERVFLRRSRKKEGERLPHRIKLDKVTEGDSLIVEIVFSKKNGIWKCYRLRPEQLSGRKSVAFSVSGNEVYWLRGLAPDSVDPSTLPLDPEPAAKAKRGGRSVKPQSINDPSNKPDRRILVFDSNQLLDSIFRNVASASKATHIQQEFIEKLCKKKRPSQETGLSFRILREKFSSDDRIISFRLTLAEFDEKCKRGKKNNIE